MTSLARRTFHNIGWMAISELFAKGLIFLVSLYLARVLGTAEFGKYSLAVAVSLYLMSLIDLGITGYGTREVARRREDAAHLLGILNSLRLVAAGAALVAAAAVLFFLDLPGNTGEVIFVGAAAVVGYALSPDWVVRGLERMEYVALNSAVVSLGFAVLCWLYVRSPGSTMEAVAFRSALMLLGSIATLLVVKGRLRLTFTFRIRTSLWRPHVRESFYFAINGIFNTMALYLPLLIVSISLPMTEAGLFSAPQRIIVLLVNASAIFSLAIYPVMSHLYIEDRERFRTAHRHFERAMLYFGIPVGVCGMVLSRAIIGTLYDPRYAASAGTLAIMIWVVPLMLLRSNYGITLASAGYHRFNMFATGTGAIINAIAGFMFVPQYASGGAAMAMVIGETSVLALMEFLFRRKVHRLAMLDGYFFKIVLASAAVGLILRELEMPLLLSIVLGFILYVGLTLGIGVTSVSKIRDTYRKIVHKQPNSL